MEIQLHFSKRLGLNTSVEIHWDLDLSQGLIAVLFGPSGAGKTTLLRCLAGLDLPDSGSIRVNGRAWFDTASRQNLPTQKRSIGYVFQDYALFPHLTVMENVTYGIRHLGREERRREAGLWLERLGIGPLKDRLPALLSGGEQQRVGLARALVTRPQLLLLDEPFSALDGPTRETLRRELRAQLLDWNIPVLMVSHDRYEVLAFGDQLAIMDRGTILQVGEVMEVFHLPVSQTVAQITGTDNVLGGRITGSREGLATVEVDSGSGGVNLVAPNPEGLCGPVILCIRGEEVVLDRDPGARTSARNHIPGTVEKVSYEGPLARITLRCPFALVALVTRSAVAEMDIRPGVVLEARIKAPSIRFVPRGG